MRVRNFEQAIRDFTNRKPFQAFFIELKSGRVVLVDHPEAMITRKGQAVWIGTGGDLATFDAGGVVRVHSGRGEAAERAS